MQRKTNMKIVKGQWEIGRASLRRAPDVWMEYQEDNDWEHTAHTLL